MRSSVFYLFICIICLCGGLFAPPAWAGSLQFGDVSAKPTDNGARLVFSWNGNAKVAFTPESRGNKVLLHFESPVALEWDSTLETLQPYLKEVATTNGGKTVVLTLNSASSAQRFLLYSRQGVDFARNGLELTENPAVASRMPTQTIVNATPPRKVIVASKAPSPRKMEKQLARRAAPTPEPVVARAVPTPAPAPEPPPPAPQLATADAEALARLSPAAGENTPQPPAPSPQPQEERTPSATAPKAEAKEDASKEKSESLALPLLTDDPVALLIYNKTLWIAAGESAHLSEEAFKSDNPSLRHTLQTVAANKQGIVLSLALDGYTNASIQKMDDGKLHLKLDNSAGKPQNLLVPTLATQNEKSALNVSVPKPGTLITISDPATGRTIHLLPSAEAGTGMESAHALVEFSLLPTLQGLAVQQVSDKLSVTQEKDTLHISTPAGLAISPEMKHALEEAKSGAIASKIPPVFYPYALWKLDDEKKFVSTQIALFHETNSSNTENANQARLKLLGLYLAEGLFAEANGMANDILRSSYKFYVEHKVAALRAAANFMRYRFAEAEQDFQSPELEGLPETAMWIALCGELLGHGKDPFVYKNGYDKFIKYYPPGFIQKIAIIAADRTLARKDYDATNGILDSLQKAGIDEPVKKFIDLMRARIYSENGNEDEAAKIWERQAADITDRLIRARAEFSLVNMYLKEDKIPVEDAIKRLEKLRIVWRGDALELNVLNLLGSLYEEKKDFARALRAWRDIVAYYPEVPEAITIAAKMEDIFVKLYNKNGADTLPPLDALALYYEFRDLVPTGGEGDQMIRNLAERLVKIDLLDRATQLLSHQIRNRLQGTERSRVGTRLAEIYLMNRQPKEALETLKTTGYGELPADIQLARTRLTAQALAQQGQLAKAIEVLSNDTSAEGNMLRLHVYWTNRDWTNVVSMAEEILGNRNDPSAALTLPESEVLLKLATAYVYEHDSGQIQYLRDYFTPLLKGNPNRESFLFITSESGSIDYGNLSNLDRDIITVKSFIEKSHKQGMQKTAAGGEPVNVTTPEPKKGG